MAKTTKTVYVGCKLPHGLIIEVNGKKVTLNGRNSARIVSNESYGITEVDAEFWDAWAKNNANLKCLKNGFVFANNSEKSTVSEAKEKKKAQTGSEQINADSADKIEAVGR